MAYANGKIPASALVPIHSNGARLLSGPAASWGRIAQKVESRYGWTPVPTGPNDGYRSLGVQTSTFLSRYTPARTGGGYYGDIRWWNGVRYVRNRGTAAAAVPGTSNHGKGRAVDVSGLGGFGSKRYNQFAEVAASEGWSNAEGRSVGEPWHWVDLRSPDTVSNSTGGPDFSIDNPDVNAPETITKKGFLMALDDTEQQEVYDRVRDLHTLLRADGVTTGKIDQTLQWVKDIRGGVEGLPLLFAAVKSGTVDPTALAKEITKMLPGYTVQISPVK